MRIAAAISLLTVFSPAFAGDLPIPVDESPIDVRHYDVSLSLDFNARAIASTTTIEFVARHAASALRFSSPGLTIDTVSMSDQALRFENDASGLTIHLPRALAPGARSALSVTMHGQPVRGLVFDGPVVYSNYFSCDWMVCAQEDFADKASFRLTLDLPAGAGSFAPGRLETKTALANGRTRHVWRESRPYSAYLFGFAAGTFTTARERSGKIELLYLGSGVSEIELRRSFAPTPAMVEFFEQKSGVLLPQRQYAQVLVSGDPAQEKVNFSLIGADLIAARAADPQEDWAIAHELAHQWWGNSITCSDLSQFWLNEGITVFMVAAWKEHRWGREAYDRELQLLRGRVENARAAGVDRKLTSREKYPSLPLRRAIQYSKGALFMDRLRQELGDVTFWRGFKAYSRAHRGRTVTSLDLQRSFEKTSGRSLSTLFDEWVHEPTPAPE